MRHIRVGLLWVQETSEAGDLSYNKVRGECNPGDLMTKHVAAKVADALLLLMSQFSLFGELM